MEPILLALGVTLLPIYSFKSGTVQYAHVVLAFFMLVRFSHQRTSLTRPEGALLCLTLLSFIVESFAVATGAPVLSMLEPAYLAFNTLIVITFMRIPLNEPNFRLALIGALVASTVIATVSVWYYGASLTVIKSGWERSVGLFNNPNQQAYFAVCISSIAGLLYLRGVLSRNVCLFLWAACMILVMVAVSRASSAAMIALLAFGFASFANRERMSPLVMIGALVVILGVWVAYSNGLLDNLQFVQRIKDTTNIQRNDSLVYRGYTIPFHDPISFLFGEGAEKARVGSMFHRIEVHSTWWSFMGKYGVIGFTLWMGVWFAWSRAIFRERGALGLLIVVLPQIMNGITQNNSRFTPLWILIGLSLNTTLLRSESGPAKWVPRRFGNLVGGPGPRPISAMAGAGQGSRTAHPDG